MTRNLSWQRELTKIVQSPRKQQCVNENLYQMCIVCVCVCVCVCESKTERVSLHCVWSKQELLTSLEEISIMCMPRRQPKEEEAQYWL